MRAKRTYFQTCLKIHERSECKISKKKKYNFKIYEILKYTNDSERKNQKFTYNFLGWLSSSHFVDYLLNFLNSSYLSYFNSVSFF